MLDRIIDTSEKIIITVGLASATLLLFANVVARYAFDSGFTWVLEAVQYLFAWVVLVGAAYGTKEGVHLGIDIMVEKFSPENQRRITLLALACSLGFVVTVLILSIRYTIKIYEWGDLSLDLQIPQWIPYLAIPFGLTLMTYHMVHVGIKLWKGEITRIHKKEADDYVGEIQE
ncbi:MAG: TRAP transporter small permease [Magnetococcales bacterium]|nr:TRAP transporter small permease [Magnetococcales bacterium]